MKDRQECPAAQVVNIARSLPVDLKATQLGEWGIVRTYICLPTFPYLCYVPT